jgi:fibronectin type 3 domain-containing protein
MNETWCISQMIFNQNLIKKSLIGGICFIFILILLGMSATEAKIQRSGGENQACGICHTDAGGIITIAVVNWPGTYSLNTQYIVTVSVSDSVLLTSDGGVWISTGGDGTLGIGTDLHLKKVGDDLTHSDTGAKSWTFTWGSPATNLGTVTLTVYAMVANNGQGSNGDSWDSVTHDSLSPPSTVPSSPQTLTAIAGNNQASLSWGTPASDGGSTIIQYNIYRATTSGGTYTNIANTSGLTYVDNSVTNGIAYFYNVTAVNVVGEGPSSNEASATPSTVPSAPQTLSAIAGNNEVSLNWGVPASNGGSVITQYNMYRATTSGGTYTNIANTSGLTYVDSSVSNGITYFYNVTAVNVAGEGPSSNEASATPSTVPSAPQFLTATSGDNQVSLNWGTPVSNGGSAITQYNVFRATTSGGTYTNIANTSGLNYVDSSVSNGITYFYNVTAVNIAGEGPSSNEASATPSTVPSAPQTLIATSGDNQVSLNWGTPADDGGSAITQYNVYRATTSGGTYTNIANTSGLTYVDNTVTNGITYYYNVTAVNVAGEGPSSSEASTIPIGPPTAPETLEASYVANNVILNWTVPSNDGGSAITKYRIYRDTTIGLPAGTNIGNVTSTELSFVDTQVSAGVRYYYVVTAVNNEGESTISNEVAITAGDVPSVPQNPSSTHGNNQILLNWSVPTTQGGSAITHYQIYRGTTSGGPYINIVNTTELSYIDTSVTNGVTYHYVITAVVNNEGESGYSTEVSATPATVPNSPQNLLATSGDTQVSLTWAIPSDDGGSVITHYQVYRAMTSGGPYTNIAHYQVYRAMTSGGPYTNIANTTALSYIDTSVTNGVTYHYIITAVNNEGESVNSTEVSATPATFPNSPQSLLATSGDTQVSLTWATSYIDTSVTNGVTYHYVITAVNNEGESGYSTEVSATPATFPNSPQSLLATSGDTQVSLTWATPSDDGGSAITHYQVYRTTTSGGPYTNIANTTALSYIDTTVTNGVTYHFVITAVNNEGESVYSTEVSTSFTTTTTTQSSSTTSTVTTFISTSSSTTTSNWNNRIFNWYGYIIFYPKVQKTVINSKKG